MGAVTKKLLKRMLLEKTEQHHFGYFKPKERMASIQQFENITENLLKFFMAVYPALDCAKDIHSYFIRIVYAATAAPTLLHFLVLQQIADIMEAFQEKAKGTLVKPQSTTLGGNRKLQGLLHWKKIAQVTNPKIEFENCEKFDYSQQSEENIDPLEVNDCIDKEIYKVLVKDLQNPSLLLLQYCTHFEQQKVSIAQLDCKNGAFPCSWSDGTMPRRH